MRTSEPANEKYKQSHSNFSNLVIITKSVLPGKVQLTQNLCALHHGEIGRGKIQR